MRLNTNNVNKHSAELTNCPNVVDVAGIWRQDLIDVKVTGI